MPAQNESSIHLLPSYLIDQIKAGEVVERPSALIKELLENSIDAKASEINIHIRANGLELIKIEDNGNGMSFYDLPLAFTRHATSKLKSFEDLFKLHSYGFRGEALASAASVSRVKCLSAKENGTGGSIILEAQKIIEHQPYAGKQGTSLIITDLFFNTPVRLKFVKGQIAEKNSIKKILNAFFLSCPSVKWSYQLEDKEKEILLPTDKTGRFQDLLNKRKKEQSQVLSSQKTYDDINVELLLSPTSASTEFQFIFVNQRLIEDRTLLHIITKALSPPSLDLKNTPSKFNFVIFISTPLDFVDINVHPNKTVVKFQSFSIINSLLFNLCQEALKSLIEENSLLAPKGEENDFIPLLPNNNLTPERAIERSPETLLSFPNSAFYLMENFVLEKENGHLCLYDIDQMNYFLISHFYQKNKLNKEENLIPLLIAWPLKIKNDSSLLLWEKNLKKLHIEFFEQEGLFLIKGVPPFLNLFGFKAIKMLEDFLNSNNTELSLSSIISFFKMKQLKKYFEGQEIIPYFKKLQGKMEIDQEIFFKKTLTLEHLKTLFNM